MVEELEKEETKRSRVPSNPSTTCSEADESVFHQDLGFDAPADLFRKKTSDERVSLKFWTGTYPVDPSRYTIDCKGKIGTVEEMKPIIEEVYAREGVVHLTNTGITDIQEGYPYVRLVVKEQMAYDGGANAREELEPFYLEVGAPLAADLHYHHEMVYVSKSTKQLGFVCKHTPAEGGATFLSESINVTDELLATPLGQKLKDLGVCYHRNLTNAAEYEGLDQRFIYNHWQRSTGCEKIEDAITFLQERSLECEVGVDPFGKPGFIKTKFYADVFEYCPELDRNVLYSSIADHDSWFDTWPAIKDLAPENRPIHMTFGDGSPFTYDEWRQWVNLYEKNGFPINWQRGDIAVFCNYRFAHGRPAIHLKPEEKRELGVVLGPTFDRVGQLDGKW